jgi:ABC-2 type transport system ATP-binding protein
VQGTPDNNPDIPSSAQAAIEIVELRKLYRGVNAVDSLSVSVPEGSFFGFLGPNGAGKTTTIKILTGLIHADSGSVKVLGMQMPEQSLEIRKVIGLVPDDSLLFDYLNGAEYLNFIGRLYRLGREVAAERARELLELFELDDRPKKLIGEYSKGMRKRIAMAAALIHRPRLFLMDEPFEGVDAVGARLMKDILVEQVQHGATIFLTSHVLEVVERLCDRVAIIDHGKVIAEGSVDELRKSGSAGSADSLSLEDIFVNLVQPSRTGSSLNWL